MNSPAVGWSSRGVKAWSGVGAAATLAVVLFAAQRPSRAQDPAQQPTFRVSVDRIQIGAVVTDAKGRHVTDLGMGEFTILDGGRPQQITQCEYVRLANPGLAAPAVPQQRGSLAPPLAPIHELTREQVQRTIVFLLDDESFAATTIPAVRESVRSTIERSVQPGDLAALIRTSSGNGSLEQFTSDKRVLLESAERVRWRPEGRANPGILPQTSGYVVGEDMGKYLVADSEKRTTAVLHYGDLVPPGSPREKGDHAHLTGPSVRYAVRQSSEFDRDGDWRVGR